MTSSLPEDLAPPRSSGVSWSVAMRRRYPGAAIASTRTSAATVRARERMRIERVTMRIAVRTTSATNAPRE
jgi:hypothetical protein